jgi:hypothetical protein
MQMNQSLSVGITRHEAGWARILGQEGIHFYRASLKRVPKPEKFAAIILNSALNKTQLENILSYVKSGGAVLATPETAKQLLPNLDFCFEKVRPVHPKGKFFHGSGFLWLDQRIAVFPFHAKGKPFEEKIGEGLVLVLPFDPNSATLEKGFEARAFYSKKAFPKELASKTSKAAVRAFARNALMHLFGERSIPFVQLWYYPKQFQTAFCFHVDLDFIDKDTQTAARIFNSSRLRPYWFLNMAAAQKAEKKFLKTALEQGLVGQHGFEHGHWPSDEKKSFQNTAKADKALKKLGVKTKAFSAPNGVWSEGIALALEKLEYDFCITFSLDNDNLPFNPLAKGKECRFLLIPTHPVCIALLKQYDLSEQEITEYFLGLIKRNKKANLPIMLYSHPFKEIARFPKAIQAIAKKTRPDKSIWKTDYTEFSKWWAKRQKSRFSLSFDGASIHANASCPKNASFRLLKNGKQFFFPAKTRKQKLSSLKNPIPFFACFIEDTAEKASHRGPKHFVKNAAGKALDVLKKRG